MQDPQSIAKVRRALLLTALALALVLAAFDRYAAWAHRPSPDSTRVAIYTTQWCPYCKRLRADLAASGVQYTEYDVEHTLQGQLGFWTLRGRGVPVSVIGPTVVHGYRVDQIASALQALGFTFRSALPQREASGASGSETEYTSLGATRRSSRLFEEQRRLRQ